MAAYQNVVCLFEGEAREALAVLDERGEQAALEHLKSYHDESGEGTFASSHFAPWKDSDSTHRDGDFVLYYDRAAGYIGLAIEIDLRRAREDDTR